MNTTRNQFNIGLDGSFNVSEDLGSKFSIDSRKCEVSGFIRGR